MFGKTLDDRKNVVDCAGSLTLCLVVSVSKSRICTIVLRQGILKEFAHIIYGKFFSISYYAATI